MTKKTNPTGIRFLTRMQSFYQRQNKSTQGKHGRVEVEAADDKALQYINNHSQAFQI